VIFMATRHRHLYSTRLRTPLLIACRVHRIVTLKYLVPASGGLFPRLLHLLPAESPYAPAPLVVAQAILLGYQLASFTHVLISAWTVHLPLSTVLASCALEPAAYAASAVALQRIFTPILPSVALVSLDHPWSCLHVRFWALITFGLALPLTATSLSEERFRRRFLEEKGVLVLYPPRIWTVLHAGACLVLFSAILWALGESAAMTAAVAARTRSSLQNLAQIKV
jgi:hypothetical protein